MRINTPMKKISVVIPTYNEEENIPLIYDRVKKLFENELKDYKLNLLFVDNSSNDSSEEIIKQIAKKDECVQYIFYIRNFGFSNSTYYGITQADGDAVVLLFADFQDPPELIVDFVRCWEDGNPVVIGIKNKSDENKMIFFIRSLFYKFANIITSIQHIEHFTGFGLYDKSVIEILRKINDPLPYLRGIIAEIAPPNKRIYYNQNKRKHGKSSFNFWKLYDVAMLGITSYSKSLMRISVVMGFVIALLSIGIGIVTLLLKIFDIINYPTGTAAIICGVFFLGSLQMIFIGLLGEYVSNINIRSMNHPLVVEKERWNI